jgi:hypothetical protein
MRRTKGRRSLERPRHSRRIILKMKLISRSWMGRHGLDFSASG